METAVLALVRLALLILLWVFILLALYSMRVDANAAAGVRADQRQAAPPPEVRREPVRQITVVEGPLVGSHMDISQAEAVTLGRSQDVDFILGDDYASARHARLFRRGSDWFVEDLESRNGTFVNGYRIDQPERVSAGVDVKMGSTSVRLLP